MICIMMNLRLIYLNDGISGYSSSARRYNF